MLAATPVPQSHPDAVHLHSKLLLPSLFQRRASKRIQSCRFSPTDRLFAVVFEDDRHVSIWSYEVDAVERSQHAPSRVHSSSSSSNARLITVVRHSRPVAEVGWHVGSPTTADPNPKHHLVTRTHDDVVRIWAPLIDEPSAFRTISVTRKRSAAGKQRSADKDGSVPALQRRRCDQFSERFEQHDRLHTKSLADHIAQTTLVSDALESDVIGNSCHSLDESRWPSAAQEGNQNEQPHATRHPTIKVSASWDVRRVEANGSNDAEASSSRSVEQAVPISSSTTSFELTLRRKTEAISASFSEHGEVIEARFAFPVKDASCRPILKWTTVEDTHSKAGIPVLAVVLDDSLYVLAPQRVSRWQPNRWSEVARLQVGKGAGQVDERIDNVIWLTQNRLMISQDRQVWLFDDKLSEQANKATKKSKAVKESFQTKADQGATLNERVIRQNAPLSDIEAETLYRCIFWGQLATALRIIERTKRPLSASLGTCIWTDANVQITASPAERRSEVETIDTGTEELQNLIADCKEQIESNAGDSARRLLVILQLAFDVRKLSGQLDDNAVRYLALHATRPSEAADQERAAADTLPSARSVFGGGAKQSPARLPAPQSLVDGFIEEETARLSVWALHSQTQEPLLQHLQHLYGGSQRMDWSDARRLGIVMWLGSVEMLRQSIESCARAQYTAGNQHDPTSCALLYYALGKDKLVLQLWKQAVWHPEHQKMLRFLQQDFRQQRWKAAAQKNAYALLSQRRFEMAATFFLLGECLEDAVNVCVRNLHDVVLAIALCRVWQDEATGQRVLKCLIVDVILPAALQSANVWTIAWATHYLGHRDLSLLALTSVDVRPLTERLHSVLNVAIPSHSDHSSESRAVAWDAEAAILLYRTNYSTKDLAPDGKASASTVRLEHSILHEALHTLRVDGVVGLAMALASQWRFREERADDEPVKPEAAQPPVQEKPQDTPSATGQPAPEPPTSSFSAAMGVKKTSSAAVASNMDFDLDAWG